MAEGVREGFNEKLTGLRDNLQDFKNKYGSNGTSSTAEFFGSIGGAFESVSTAVWATGSIVWPLVVIFLTYLFIGLVFFGIPVFMAFGTLVQRCLLERDTTFYPRAFRCLLPRIKHEPSVEITDADRAGAPSAPAPKQASLSDLKPMNFEIKKKKKKEPQSTEEADSAATREPAGPELSFGFRAAAAAIYAAAGVVCGLMAALLWAPLILLFFLGYVNTFLGILNDWAQRGASQVYVRQTWPAHLIALTISLPAATLAFGIGDFYARQIELRVMTVLSYPIGVRVIPALYQMLGPRLGDYRSLKGK